jgi:hypothetical protein
LPPSSTRTGTWITSAAIRGCAPNFRTCKVYASSAIDAARAGFLADYRAQLVTEIGRSAKNPEAQESMRAEVALIDAGAALGPTDVIANPCA